MKIQDMNVLVYHFQTFTVKHSRSSRIEYNFCKAGWRLTKGSLTLKYYWKIFIFNLRKGKSKTKRNISIIFFFFLCESCICWLQKKFRVKNRFYDVSSKSWTHFLLQDTFFISKGRKKVFSKEEQEHKHSFFSLSDVSLILLLHFEKEQR